MSTYLVALCWFSGGAGSQTDSHVKRTRWTRCVCVEAWSSDAGGGGHGVARISMASTPADASLPGSRGLRLAPHRDWASVLGVVAPLSAFRDGEPDAAAMALGQGQPDLHHP